MIRLAVRCPDELADQVLAELAELSPNGIEEDGGDGWVEYAIYGPPGEVPSLGDVVVLAEAGRVEVSTTEIPDDWADRWRDFHRPVVVGSRLTVQPSWHDTNARRLLRSASGSGGVDGGMEFVVIDPGQAFGTGGHATTRMCLELLLELADRGEAAGQLADLGTGSGVLAIAAAKLGWAPVSGFDHEAAAVEAAMQNASVNGVEVQVQRVNLREELPELAPTVVANLTAPLLLEVAARIERSPERLVCSGLLASERERVEEAFAGAGLIAAERREDGDWAALLLTR